MKIVLLAGMPNWAADRRCHYLSDELTKLGHQCIVDNHDSRSTLTAEIIKDYAKKNDILHFQFTGFASRFNYVHFLSTKCKVGITVVSERTLEGYDGNDKPEKLFEFISKCDFVTASNPRISDLLTKRKIENTYIPHGVDTELFNPGKFRVGYVGAKDEYKGFPMIKKACEELGCELITDTSPQNIMGHCYMPELYKKMDCYVCASKAEGCNNGVLEALAMNVPVISTDVGIASELGVTIIKRSISGIKAGIQRLMVRNKILKKYKNSIIAKQYDQVYRKAVGVQSPKGIS